VFALPFALTAAALAAQEGGVSTRQLLWIVVAMVSARSAAMGFNRLVDHGIDARNPRTASRELPKGIVSRAEAWTFVAVSAAALVLAAAMLNPLCLMLSPLAIAIVLGYSYAKRFTAASHLWLGLALAVAPVGAWLAIRGRFDAPPVVLALAVLLWVAGFDTLYACQDVDFDRSEGLRSLPASLGVARALVLARAMHVGTVLLLLLLFRLLCSTPVPGGCRRSRRDSRLGALAGAAHGPPAGDAGLQPQRLGEPRLLRRHGRVRLARRGKVESGLRWLLQGASRARWPLRRRGRPNERRCGRCSTGSRRATTC
jgi:4-hydroxybenzoate polyprenyltransferase